MEFFKRNARKLVFLLFAVLVTFSFGYEVVHAEILFSREGQNGNILRISNDSFWTRGDWVDLVSLISQSKAGLNNKDLLSSQGVDAKGNATITLLDPERKNEAAAKKYLGLSIVDQAVAQGNPLSKDYWASAGAASQGAALEESELPSNADAGVCFDWHLTSLAFNPLNCISQFLYILLWLVSYVVTWLGGLFDIVFQYTVVEIKKTLGNMDVIKAVWATVRDLCNIFFIFILLWLGISTILQLDEHGVKHGLSRLIVAAILINFSLLFTTFIIDIPNKLSIILYNQTIGYNGSNGALNGGSNGANNTGLGAAVFAIIQPAEIGKKLAAGASKSDNMMGATSEAGRQAFASQGPVSSLTTFVMMIILYATVLFVFLAVCIIFIKRFVILIFLMIFSPLAFLGMAVPIHSLQHEAQSKFWNTLFKESFYAPIFMLCFYVSMMVGKTAYAAASGSTVGLIFAFSLVIIMMIASLIIAEEMGVSGAGGAMTAFKGMSEGTAGWVQSRTIGRVASTLINKTNRGDQLRDMAAGKYGKNIFTRTALTALGRGIVGTSDKLGASFDEKVKHDQEWTQAAIDNRHGDHRFTAELFAQGAGDSMYSADRKMLDNQFHHMNIEQKANMYEYLKDMAKRNVGDKIIDSHGHDTGKRVTKKDIEGAEAAKFRYFEQEGHGRLEADEVAQLPRTTAEGLTYHDDKFRHEINAAVTNAKGGAIDKADIAKIKHFMKNATEGQMLSAIKGLGKTAMDFEGDGPTAKELRKTLAKGLTRFQGESMLASITKDSVLGQGVKTAAADSAYQRKAAFDLYNSIKGLENQPGAKDIADKLADEMKDFTEFEPALIAYKTSGGSPAGIEALTKAFQEDYSGWATTANYVANGNGKRTLIKSVESDNKVNGVAKLIEDTIAKTGTKFKKAPSTQEEVK